MGALANVRNGIAAGFKGIAWRFPTTGTGFGPGSAWRGVFSGLAGSSYDYNREAGVRYDNSVVYSAISFASRAFVQAPAIVEQRVSRRKYEAYESESDTDPLNQLLDILDAPNDFYGAQTFWAGMLLSYIVRGNAYAYKVRSGAGKPIGLIYIPHFMLYPHVREGSGDWITSYVYKVDGKEIHIKPSDIFHLRYGLDPLNQRMGLSPTHAVLREICTENEAATFSAALLRNGAVPGLVVSPKSDDSGVSFSDEQAKRLQALIPERFGGDRRGEPLILDYPVDVSVPGFSPEQLVLDKVRSIPVSRICSVLGIDPMVLGLPSDTKTYSNFAESMRGAYDNCIIPMWNNVAEQFSRDLLPEFTPAGTRPGMFRVSFDLTAIPALQENEDDKHDRARQDLMVGLVKRSEARLMIGLESEPEDEDYFPNASAIPASDVQEQTQAGIDAANQPAGDKPTTDGKPTKAYFAAVSHERQREALSL